MESECVFQVTPWPVGHWVRDLLTKLHKFAFGNLFYFGSPSTFISFFHDSQSAGRMTCCQQPHGGKDILPVHQHLGLLGPQGHGLRRII